MPDLAEAFEQHLRSLSDDEWTALVARVRPDDHDDAGQPKGSKSKSGLAEARRRGYVTDTSSDREGGTR